MLLREKVINHIQTMPAEFSIDDLMEKLLFIYKVEEALAQSAADQVIPHEKIKAKHKKWLR